MLNGRTIFCQQNRAELGRGKYAFVADPDPGEDGIDPVFPGDPSPLSNELIGPGTLTAARKRLPGVAGLAGNPNFENGNFSATGETEITHSSILTDDEWLVRSSLNCSGIHSAAGSFGIRFL